MRFLVGKKVLPFECLMEICEGCVCIVTGQKLAVHEFRHATGSLARVLRTTEQVAR